MGRREKNFLWFFCVTFGFSCVDIGLGELWSGYPGISLDLYCMLIGWSCLVFLLIRGGCLGGSVMFGGCFYETGT